MTSYVNFLIQINDNHVVTVSKDNYFTYLNIDTDEVHAEFLDLLVCNIR